MMMLPNGQTVPVLPGPMQMPSVISVCLTYAVSRLLHLTLIGFFRKGIFHHIYPEHIHNLHGCICRR